MVPMNTADELVTKLTTSQADMVEHWKDLDAQIKKLTEERDSIKEKLEFAMTAKGARMATFRNRMLVQMHHWTRRSLDTKALKVEAPALVERFMRTNEGTRIEYL